MRKIAVVFSILVLPFAFHSVQAQSAEMKAGAATVSGHVTLKGEPARGMTIVLQPQKQPRVGNPSRVRVDESGQFHFSSVPAGGYLVFAVAPDYVISPYDFIPYGSRKFLNLTDGEKVENFDLEIKLGGVIAGKVTDSQGRPVIKESVNLSRLDTNNKDQDTRVIVYHGANYQTDDRGFYRIFGLPEGRYLVSVGLAATPGSATITYKREFYPRVFYPHAATESEAKAVEVSEGSEAKDIDITVSDPKQTRDIEGRVVKAGDGQPAAGVQVVIGGVRDGKYSGNTINGTRSGPNGEFRIFGATPNKYAVLASPDTFSGDGEYVSDPVIVDLSEESKTGVEVNVRQGATISGVAVVERTSDQNVQANLSQIRVTVNFTLPDGHPAPSRIVNVNADGSFHINGLQSGRALISNLESEDTRGLVMERIEHDGKPAPDGIDVVEGERVTGVRVILTYGSFAIRGEFRVVGGTLPAADTFFAYARTIDQSGQFHSIGSQRIDSRGQFTIENLPPGEYEIGIAILHPVPHPLSPEIGRLIRSLKERVVLSGKNSAPVVLTLDLSRRERDR
ncbi:MAG: carboxypeptidase regulatory-like domain-containing protein [Chloracidobacterium sp.]|nr:carboxypeptidase regulatory-like domain-containing protein [Chloracidobacterium sp.]